MITPSYDIGDIISITYRGISGVPARISSFTDSLDRTMPIYINLRTPSGRWSKQEKKIYPRHIEKEEKL